MHTQRQKKASHKNISRHEANKKRTGSEVALQREEKNTQYISKPVSSAEAVMRVRADYESTKFYSRRKIASNWKKYSDDKEDVVINEEEIAQRISLLLSSHTTAQLPPPLPAQTTPFNLDLDMIAKSISPLPLHECLNIDEHLFRLATMQYSTKQQHLTIKPRKHNNPEQTEIPSIKILHSSSSVTKSHLSSTVTKPHPTTSGVSQDKELNELLMVEQHTPVTQTMKEDHEHSGNDDRHEELDALLDDLLD